jgi:hypothetical protein
VNRAASLGTGLGTRIARVVLVAVVGLGLTLPAGDLIGTAFYLSYCAVGTWLAIRRPRHPIGWLLIVIVVLLASQDNSSASIAAVASRSADPVTTLAVWFGSWTGGVVYVGYLALAIVFPSGRLPGGPWRRPASAILGLAVATVVMMAFAPTIAIGDATIPNPVPLLAWLPAWGVLDAVGPYPVLLVLVAVGVASQVVRYRRATGILHQQLRWLVTAVVLVLAGLVVGFVGSALDAGTNGAQWLLVVAAYPLVPISIGVAVLRYRLYAIDRIISRTIAYAGVIAILGTAFVGLILTLQTVLSPVTGGGTIAVAASTLAVFALFQPLLRRVRVAVERRFDRTRYDADMTVRTFAARLRGDIDLTTVSVEIVDTATSAVRPAAAAVWLRAKVRATP